MTKLIVPLIFIIAAIGLFVVYTNPTYQASKSVQAQVASYDAALTKSQQLRQVRDSLISKRNTFSPDDVAKLQKVLPDNVDNIRLIIDINNIASRHSLALSNVGLGDYTGSASGAQKTIAIGTTQGPVGSVDVTFSLNASYANMLAFLADIEHSLRLVDVEKLTFASAATNSDTYNFTIQTYWLH
jgi:Tfp pilus assembly protein PilO